MVTIAANELLLGTLGIASSIYDPWVDDPFAPVLVTLARTTGVICLFLVAGVGFLVLAATREMDVDPTNIAVIFFAAGAPTPTFARGVWSMIDMGIMFSDLMYESYKPTDHNPLPGTVANSRNGAPNMQTSNADKIGCSGFLAWTVAAFLTLMIHNVSFHKLAPYQKDLFRSCGRNIKKIVYGKPMDRWTTLKGSDLDWGRQSWASRLKGLLILLALNIPCCVFLTLQTFAMLGESLILAVGSACLSVAIAAHVNILKEDLAQRRTNDPVLSPNCSGQPLRQLVEDLICCKTCNHKVEDRNHLTGISSSENEKGYLYVMPKVRATFYVRRSLA